MVSKGLIKKPVNKTTTIKPKLVKKAVPRVAVISSKPKTVKPTKLYGLFGEVAAVNQNLIVRRPKDEDIKATVGWWRALGEATVKKIPVMFIRITDNCAWLDNKKIRTLKNNPSARDPTYAQVRDFVQADSTKLRQYVDNNTSNDFVCHDFSELLHNKAETSGIRCFFAALRYKTKGFGHAVNCFRTTDAGLVFVDTSSMATRGGFSAFIYTEKEFFDAYAQHMSNMLVFI